MENTQPITKPEPLEFPDPDHAISLKDFAKVDCTVDELPNGKVKTLQVCGNCGREYMGYDGDPLGYCPDCEEMELLAEKFG